MTSLSSPGNEETSPQPAGSARLLWLKLYAAAMSVSVCAVIILFFGALIGGFFELFVFIDWLIQRPWAPDTPSFTLAIIAVVVGILVIRIAWRLALLLLGVLTPKYDESVDGQDTLLLDPNTYSGLYELIADVCRLVSAPNPDEIRVAAMPECYVLEQRQFSLRTSRQLILVLGLPEMLMLTTAELRVIVAHEMVHFRNHHTTAVVFLFRFLESLRRTWEPLSHRRFYQADPIYWFFRGFHRLVASLCQPIQRHQELHADAVSGTAYGGDLAVQTLLKDWLLANEFEEALHEFQRGVREQRLSARSNIYTFFVDRSHAFSHDSQRYLEQRLLEDQANADDDHPTMRRRLLLLRSLPPGSLREAPLVSELLPQLGEIQRELQGKLVQFDLA